MSSTLPSPTTSLHDLLDLSDRTAVVTGGAKGIGLGIARRLHEAGASVVLADLDPAAARDAVAELEEHAAGRAIAVGCDVSDPAQIGALVVAADERFGGIDVLVNNAGIFPSVPFLEMDEATFRRIVDVNLVGLFLCTQAVARGMVERGRGGRIVNITSIDALHPSMVGLAAYDASKHGVWGFTKNVALELAPHGIWVNAIAPGGVMTPGVADLAGGTVTGAALEAFEAAIPMHRFGDVDEIGRAVLFLSSDLSGYMTGSQIVVDGGRLLA